MESRNRGERQMASEVIAVAVHIRRCPLLFF
jgi:hypothetical protein